MITRKARILLTADYLTTFSTGLLGPLFAVFAQEIGGDILDISWAWAAYLISTGAFMILFGKISDKKAKKEKLIFFSYLAQAGLTLGYLFVANPWQLLLLQLVLGIVTSMAFPTWDALFARYEDRKNAGFSWGLVDGGEELIMGVAIIAGGLVVTYFSFATLFIIMALVQVFAAFDQARLFKIKNIFNPEKI